MIEVRVRDEDEIDRRQMMDVKARFFESLDHAEPHRPDRIDQNVRVVRLDQKRRVSDPSDANLSGLHFWKKRLCACARAFGKERGDPNARDKIPLGPIASGTQLDALRFLRARVLRMADNLALFRKGI